MPEILHCFTIKAPTNKIYAALTEQKGLASWWTKYCKAQATVDTVAEFSFNNGEVKFRMKIVKLIPNRLVVWRCVGGHPEWNDTQITFDLRAQRDKTVMSFSHTHWQSMNGLYPQCNFDWAHYLMSLRAYVERGKGFPARY